MSRTNRKHTSRSAARRCSECGKSGHDKRAHERRRTNPTDQSGLLAARRVSREYHGSTLGVVELNARERGQRLPRYMVLVGDLVDFSYSPPKGSRKAGIPFRHKVGDVGLGLNTGGRRPRVLVDPRGNKREMHILMDRSDMQFSPERGFVG